MSRLCAVFLCIGTFLVLVGPLSAQNFTSDARLVAMGGMDIGSGSIRLAGNARPYRSIGIPLGLFQVFNNTNVFRPDSSEFNPLLALELLGSPLHYTFGRSEDGPGERLVSDLVNGTLTRDLNRYRGFKPKPQFDMQGLVKPSFGKTLPLQRGRNGTNHGIYVGAGPYLALGTAATVDDNLVRILSGSSDLFLPNTSFHITNSTNGQAAMAVTFGYRGRIGLAGGRQDRDGVYVAANYNYLRGFRYDSASVDVRFATDSLGLVTLTPTIPPVIVNHTAASSGQGRALDLGTGVVVDRWQFNASVDGIANHIDWKEQTADRLVLGNLFQGLAFVKTTLPAPSGTTRVTLPVQYRAGGAYYAERWTASTEFAHGLQKFEYRAGAEYRLAVVELRGGVHYKHEDWEPTGGVGINLTRHFGIDAALFGVATNIERERRAAFALSLRISRD